MIYLGFVAIFEGVIRPPNQRAPGVRCEGRQTGFFAVRQWPLVAVLGRRAWGCRDASTPTGPKPNGPNLSPPAITTFPGRDMTVDSIGLLNIEVIARDQSLIDTVTDGITVRLQ